MFSKVKCALFASAFCSSVAIGGTASAVTFSDLDIIDGGDQHLVDVASGTVETSGTLGSMVIEEWVTFLAVTEADKTADAVDFVGPAVEVISIFDPAKPDPNASLSAIEISVAPAPPQFIPPGWAPFDIYLSGNLIETRQVDNFVMEGLFERTDDRTVPDFGDYLIIRFTTSVALVSGMNSGADIQVYGAVEKVSGIPLPGGLVFLATGMVGLISLRRVERKG